MDKLRVMWVPAGEAPRTVHIEGDELMGLQKLVGGPIESASWMFGDDMSVYVNAEGKTTCEPNRAVYMGGTLVDIIFGDFVCCGFDPDTGEDRDIADEQEAMVRERFADANSGIEAVAAILATAR